MGTPGKASATGNSGVAKQLIDDCLLKLSPKSFMASTTNTKPSTTNANNHNNNNNNNSKETYGALTQRLLSSLVEQDLLTPFDNELATYLVDKMDPPQVPYASP